MPTEEETRRLVNSLRHYRGFVFRWQTYKTVSPEWNHDHCTGCWARFAERPEGWPDAVHTAGWVTLWPTRGSKEKEQQLVAEWRAAGMGLVPSPKFEGFQRDWLCPTCFEACREDLAFVIDSENPPTKNNL